MLSVIVNYQIIELARKFFSLFICETFFSEHFSLIFAAPLAFENIIQVSLKITVVFLSAEFMKKVDKDQVFAAQVKALC